MLNHFTKEELRKFLAENLLKGEDELLAAVSVTFAMMKTKVTFHVEVAEFLSDMERLMLAGINRPYEDFKDQVEDFVLNKLG